MRVAKRVCGWGALFVLVLVSQAGAGDAWSSLGDFYIGDLLQSQHAPVTNGLPIRLCFEQQALPRPEARLLHGAVRQPSAAGTSSVPTSLAVSLLREGSAPSLIQLVLCGGAGEDCWYYDLKRPVSTSGEAFDVPLRFSAGWYRGLGDQPSDFEAAVSDLKWLGVLVRRGGDAAAHAIEVLALELQGVAAEIRLAGNLLYAGEQTGTGVATVLAGDGAVEASASAAGDAYVLCAPATGQPRSLQAFLDTNGNGVLDWWEARSGTVAIPGGVAQVSTNLVVCDPADSEGLPFWWLRSAFGIESAAQWGASGDGEADPDADGASTAAEFHARTDPLDPLSRLAVCVEPAADGYALCWEPQDGVRYVVLRALSPDGDYRCVATNTTGRYEVSAADAARFYRLAVATDRTP